MFGIIGGSGFEKFDEFETLELLACDTPFGKASSGFKKVRVSGTEFCLSLGMATIMNSCRVRSITARTSSP